MMIGDTLKLCTYFLVTKVANLLRRYIFEAAYALLNGTSQWQYWLILLLDIEVHTPLQEYMGTYRYPLHYVILHCKNVLL